MFLPHEKRRCQGAIAGPIIVLLALAGIAAAAWLLAAPSHRDVVAHVVVAVLVACIWGAALRFLQRETDGAPPSRFELYLHRPPQAPQFDPLFVRLRGELTHSMQSRSYFAHILWPRLVALSGQHDSSMPCIPRVSRLPWRGPSLDELARLIAWIESHMTE